MTTPARVGVVVETPQHSGLAGPLDYLDPGAAVPGQLLRVPLGRREVLGIVWPRPEQPADMAAADALRPAGQPFELPPLPAAWLALVEFAAGYYQRGLGELALSVLPPELSLVELPALRA